MKTCGAPLQSSPCLLLISRPSCPALLPAANGKSATASIAVPIARRPACTAASGSCLTVSPASGTTDATTFVASASAFVADAALVYDFGERLAGGRSEFHVRGAADPTFSFAPRVLGAGDHTLFVCARGGRSGEGLGGQLQHRCRPDHARPPASQLPAPAAPCPTPQTPPAPRPVPPPLWPWPLPPPHPALLMWAASPLPWTRPWRPAVRTPS